MAKGQLLQKELSGGRRRWQTVWRVVAVLGLLYIFILAIKLMGASFEGFGKGFVHQLLASAEHPLIGLFIGILVTSIVQSSSLVTSMLVTLVASGNLPFSLAIPMVMGANIGTTITNILVSMTHLSRRDEFQRALSGAMVHDFFNISAVIVLFPIEMLFHPLEKAAGWLSQLLTGGTQIALFSPLNAVIDPVVGWLVALTGETYWITLVLAFICLFLALRYLVKLMQQVVTDRFERVIHDYLFKTPLRAFMLGMLFTSIVQSSSVTTSMVVPLVGAGLLMLEQIYPYTLGANVGTTVTALLAALAAAEPAGLAVALAHLLFNIFGICIFYPLRIVPLSLARFFGNLAQRNRALVLVCVGCIFFVVPAVIVFFLS